eukprot:15481346-Alexandrium_andersonii.AAC.1
MCKGAHALHPRLPPSADLHPYPRSRPEKRRATHASHQHSARDEIDTGGEIGPERTSHDPRIGHVATVADDGGDT